MIATLSSFATQFDPAIIKKGKDIFEKDGIKSLTNKELLWQAEVTDTKKYKVSVLSRKNKGDRCILSLRTGCMRPYHRSDVCFAGEIRNKT